MGKHELLTQLVKAGVERLSDKPPIALKVAGTKPELPYRLPWRFRELASSADLSTAVAELLIDQPVLAFPPWEDLAPRQIRIASASGLYTIKPPNADALLIMVVPASIMLANSYRRLREQLFSAWRPLALAYRRNLFADVHHSFMSATLFLSARSEPLRLFHALGEVSNDDLDADFQQLMNKHSGRTKFGYVLQDPPVPGDSLGFDRYNPELLARKADLQGYGFTVCVSELFDLRQGRLHLVADRGLICNAEQQDSVRVIEGRHLRREGWLAPPDDQSKWATVSDDRQVQAGDILLRSVYNPNDRRGLVAVEISEQDLPAIAAHTVIVLRARAAVSEIQRRFVLQYLRLPLAQLLVNAEGDSELRLSIQTLGELQLPQPDTELRTAIEDLIDVATQFNDWQEEAEDLLDSVVLDDTAQAARARIVSLGRLLRQREEAASALDDHGYIVRTRFPYPVALRWRQAEAVVSAGPSARAYQVILEAAEVLLCYTANLAVALAHQNGTPISYTTNLRTRLASGKGGPGFGDWVAVLNELRTGKAYRSLPDTHPLAELRSLLSNPEVDAARQRLTDRRNDQAHLRPVDDTDLPTAVSAALADLRLMLEAADFLTDLPLVHVTTVRWDALHRRAVVSYRELSGDHPVVPTKTMSYETSEVEVDSLYLLDDQRRLHLLRPLLTGRICPTCRTWSTFHLERASQSGQVMLKSLEHGHTFFDATLGSSFALLGLL